MASRTIFLLSGFCLLASGSLLRAATPGSASGALLKAGSGARAASLADAQSAVADDVFGAQWNPAALAHIRAPQFGFSYNRWVADVAQQDLLLAYPFEAVGTFSFVVDRLAVEEFQAFDAQGTPAGFLDSESLAASLSWGRALSGRGDSNQGLAAGLALKVLRESHADVGASSLAADVGLLYHPGDRVAEALGNWTRRVSAGATARHMGPGLKFDRETAPLPVETSAGFGYTHFFMGDFATIGLDIRQPADEDPFLCLGLEYWHNDLFALRGGFRSGTETGPGLRLGAGLRIRRIQLDYGWSALGDDLGDTHRVSMLWRWSARRDGNPAASRDLYSFYIERARKNEELDLYDQAVLDYNRALEVRPRDPDALNGLLRAGEKMREAP